MAEAKQLSDEKLAEIAEQPQLLRGFGDRTAYVEGVAKTLDALLGHIAWLKKANDERQQCLSYGPPLDRADPTDLEFAVDVIFRAEHGVNKHPEGGYVSAAVAIQMYAMELRERGWRWDAERTPTVWNIGSPTDPPDRYCVSLENGECVSTDPRCMHQAPEEEIIDPLNLACGCSFNPAGVCIAMCEEAGRLRCDKSQEGLDAWLKHNKGSQPTILAKKRLRKAINLNGETDGI